MEENSYGTSMPAASRDMPENMKRIHLFFDSGTQVSMFVDADKAADLQLAHSNVDQIGVFDVMKMNVYSIDGPPATMQVRVDLLRVLIIEDIDLEKEKARILENAKRSMQQQPPGQIVQARGPLGRMKGH